VNETQEKESYTEEGRNALISTLSFIRLHIVFHLRKEELTE
jgi:hypothetical protein